MSTYPASPVADKSHWPSERTRARTPTGAVYEFPGVVRDTPSAMRALLGMRMVPAEWRTLVRHTRFGQRVIEAPSLGDAPLTNALLAPPITVISPPPGVEEEMDLLMPYYFSSSPLRTVPGVQLFQLNAEIVYIKYAIVVGQLNVDTVIELDKDTLTFKQAWFNNFSGDKDSIVPMYEKDVTPHLVEQLMYVHNYPWDIVSTDITSSSS